MMRSGLRYWAIDLDVLNVVRLFVESGTDPNQDALFWVVQIRNVEIVKILLERGSNPRNYVFIASPTTSIWRIISSGPCKAPKR